MYYKCVHNFCHPQHKTKKYIYRFSNNKKTKKLHSNYYFYISMIIFAVLFWSRVFFPLTHSDLVEKTHTDTFPGRHQERNGVKCNAWIRFTYTRVIHEGNVGSLEPLMRRLQSSNVWLHVHGLGHGSNPCLFPCRRSAAEKSSRSSADFTAPSGCAKADIFPKKNYPQKTRFLSSLLHKDTKRRLQNNSPSSKVPKVFSWR